MITNFSNSDSIINTFISELRDVTIQQDSMRFRRNLERIGEIIAYELSKTLSYKTQSIKTPLSKTESNLLQHQPVIATILRAGLPLHTGILNYFDKSENCFISAYRNHHSKENFEVEIEYLSSPLLSNKTVILCDPMLATGTSIVLAYKALLNKGVPSKIHVVAVVSSKEGIAYCKKHLPENTDYWIGAIDDSLNSQSYIIPGLGDAGDLAYGKKE